MLYGRHMGASPEALAALAQLPDPHVAESHGVAVILEAERKLGRVRLVRRPRLVGGGPGQLLVVLDEDTVQDHRRARRALERAVGPEARRMEDDVVGLPLAGRPCRVD